MKKSTQKHINSKQEKFYQQHQKKLQKEERNNDNFKNNKSNTMTRIDKIVAIKQSNADDIKTIKLHECTDEEIDKLHSIAVNQTKGISRSVSDWQFVNQVKKKPGNQKQVGKFQ